MHVVDLFNPASFPRRRRPTMEDASMPPALINPPDKITVDVPLLIRIMEYAREDAKTDMDLHNVTEKLISLSQEGKTLTMQDYDEIVAGEDIPNDEQMDELQPTESVNVFPELEESMNRLKQLIRYK